MNPAQTAATPTRSSKPWIVVVGGFLGAGKTTLLLAAAKELEGRGLRSAIILNDQGEALVDTSLAERNGMTSGEVIGGCFCCRFSDLISVMSDLSKHAPDVIFAEPVGSCTDIAATILRPLLEYNKTYRLAPFTVLVDPARAEALLKPDSDANLSFLFRKQLEEADLVCFTKKDLAIDLPEIEARGVRQISAKTGAGVAAWLDEVLSGALTAGNDVLDVDYKQYARAEAALAWLNLQVTLRPPEPLSAAIILGPLLDRLDAALTANDIVIVHLKGIASSSQGYVKAAICANGQSPVIEGAMDFSPSSEIDLLLNLRTVGEEAKVRLIVERTLREMNYPQDHLRISCFHPAAPKPERRIPALPQE